MVGLRWFGSMAVLTVLLAGSASRAEEQPKLLPTRDVDVRYDVTRPQQPKVRERVRWLAGEHLERVDASGRSTSIFDRDAHVVTLAHAGDPDVPEIGSGPAPAVGAGAGRRASSAAPRRSSRDCLAPTGLGRRTGKQHTVCATADGVILRLIVDGQTLIEARSVKYGPQKADLFRVPANYTPALAPEGAGEP